jgi:hypothetical protein
VFKAAEAAAKAAAKMAAEVESTETAAVKTGSELQPRRYHARMAAEARLMATQFQSPSRTGGSAAALAEVANQYLVGKGFAEAMSAEEKAKAAVETKKAMTAEVAAAEAAVVEAVEVAAAEVAVVEAVEAVEAAVVEAVAAEAVEVEVEAAVVEAIAAEAAEAVEVEAAVGEAVAAAVAAAVPVVAAEQWTEVRSTPGRGLRRSARVATPARVAATTEASPAATPRR